ncbi:MAG: UDP-N-acetylmuramoyl-tripeptide--D-alanyl-D-alanine ligase [Proteobacteria bacterium]|nr:UDP-N-acetylmuramoyl-tripeptide--D-alanyl-D-alanine ligase [Pseudomonadota bacterium]
MTRTLRELHALLPGSRLVGDGDTVVGRVHTDSRTLQPGDLFVALRGERFDGHDFLPNLTQPALAEHGLAHGIEVANSLAALQQLATGWRARLSPALIAVVGSNGKTTLTQMIGAILHAAHGEAALATAGNLNNHIGVPLTVLRLTAATRAAVVELGMNHPGEIAQLAAIAQPTVTVVSNAQREHMEFMHSVDAVAEENGQAIAALAAGGVAVIPVADAHTPIWRRLAGARRIVTFGPGGDVQGQAQWQGDHWQLQLHTPQGAAEAALHIAGRHNVRNALAAAAAAHAAGLPLAAIAAGLAAFRPVKGRSQVVALRGGRTLVDDSYNANPDSVRAAIAVLADLPAPQWLVLGDMGEVGDQGPAFHAEVGACAREAGIGTLWCAGAATAATATAYGEGARHFATTEALLAALAAAPVFASALVKGSRFMGMERVVAALQAQEATPCC